MRKLIACAFTCLTILLSHSASAMLSMELTRGVAGAVPIAVAPFVLKGDMPSQDVSAIIGSDLQNSGRFKVYSGNSVSANMPVSYYRSIGADNVVKGEVQEVSPGRYQVSFQLLDTFRGGKETADTHAPLLTRNYVVPASELRSVSHHISDLVYQQITGVRGVFSTRLAYVVVQRPLSGAARYRLEVSDYDGYNPKPLLVSTDPVMSPAWSPNGKQVAYVSFENKHASIYIQDIATGGRRMISDYPGINGAPAWSPDGHKLALVLSKDGSPNIYTMDIGSRHLTQVTSDWSINTEPAWSPDGKAILFTSNRGGNPQIYQKNLTTGAVSRVTYDGNYNARASFTPDGNHIAMINQESGLFNIGVLSLDSGTFKVLTNSSRTDNQSPSMAPNGSMVLYGTLYGGRGVLAMVATDGSVQMRLPTPDGEVQDPAWSPYLS